MLSGENADLTVPRTFVITPVYTVVIGDCVYGVGRISEISGFEGSIIPGSWKPQWLKYEVVVYGLKNESPAVWSCCQLRTWKPSFLQATQKGKLRVSAVQSKIFGWWLVLLANPVISLCIGR